MGKVSRWLKSFFGFSNGGDRRKGSFSGATRRAATEYGEIYWNPMTIPPNITPAEAAWLRSFNSKSSERRRIAAVRIQTSFRGYLARKALRALKGLVKLQACVRGCLVRKEAAATLRCMQALVRAQASIMSKRAASASLLQSPKIVEVDTVTAGVFDSGEICGGFQTSDWWFAGDEWRFSTAQSTPRLGSHPPVARLNQPSYMAETKCFNAKVRSQSAPKQRPEVGWKRRVWITEARMQRSFSQTRDGLSFKDMVAERMDRSGELGRGGSGILYKK